MRSAVLAAAGILALTIAGCGPASPAATGASGLVSAIGAENEYANVLAQIGGRYVHVSSILNNPNTDPHTFESSPRITQQVSSAQLIVQNGVGYDKFMDRIESASPNPKQKVIVVGDLLGLSTDAPNPHLWYDPRTMPAVARAIASKLSVLQPEHRLSFQANLVKFLASLTPLNEAISSFKARYAGTKAATTEPLADYLLQAMGINNLTPFAFQAAIMNGVDPSPQDISSQTAFLTRHQVRVFCYNQQVVNALTMSVRRTALRSGIPVVGVYETMPVPRYDYQSWMLAEVNAIQKAVTTRTSTQRL